MATIRIPNRSTVGFQKNEETGVYFWRNSQPVLFSHCCDGSYKYITNSPIGMHQIEPKMNNLRLFCKDSAQNEKLWMRLAVMYGTDLFVKEGWYAEENDGKGRQFIILADIESIKFTYTIGEETKTMTINSSWENPSSYGIPYPEYGDDAFGFYTIALHNTLAIDESAWHKNGFRFSINNYTEEQKAEAITADTIKRVDVAMVSRIEGEGYGIAQALSDGMSHREMQMCDSGLTVAEFLGTNGYAEIAYEEGNDHFTYSMIFDTTSTEGQENMKKVFGHDFMINFFI